MLNKHKNKPFVRRESWANDWNTTVVQNENWKFKMRESERTYYPTTTKIKHSELCYSQTKSTLYGTHEMKEILGPFPIAMLLFSSLQNCTILFSVFLSFPPNISVFVLRFNTPHTQSAEIVEIAKKNWTEISKRKNAKKKIIIHSYNIFRSEFSA